MFGKSSKKKEEEKNPETQDDIFERISREMVTHNMPAQEKIAGAVINPSVPGKVSFESSGGQKNNFKTVGIFIIIGGLLVVSLIVFLTYKFVIAPTASNNKNITLENKVENKTEDIKTDAEVSASSSPVEIPASPSDVVGSPDGNGVEQISASSSPEMPEESGGKNASDLPPLLDTDKDGLFDDEENLLGTSITSDDTDGDGYKDLAELISAYDPASKSGLLKNSSFITSYKNSVYSFNFLYPKAWSMTEPRSDLNILSAADDSLIQISVSRNEDGLGILTWFEQSFPDEGASYDNLISRPGLEAMKSADGMNVYITDEKRQNIIIISYIPASAERLAYKNIYNAIIQSFSF